MSRSRSSKPGLSPVQRKACIVMAVCVLAVVLSVVLSWIVPAKLGLFGGAGHYDPDAYPLDASLASVLGSDSADDSYITESLYVGGTEATSLQSDARISLNQFAGKEGMKLSEMMSESCVYFAGDANAYTVPQAIAKMKPRRVYVMIGSDDADGSVGVDAFINDYKQILQNIKNAYNYCDVIACAIQPVTKGSENAAERQTYIDQFNQRLAEITDEMGYKYLNLAEALKGTKGYAEDAYLDDSGKFTSAGAAAVLDYVKTHAYRTDDTRPDTNDIPQRAAQASASADTSATPTPTPTPNKLTASYRVEDNGKGTLTGSDKTGVSSLDIEATSGTQISVTAVPADGFSFYKWSDGVTTATRYDVVTKDISVTAMFNDARVELALDKEDTTINKGESLTVTAAVKLGGKAYSADGVQWSVNDDLQQNGGSYTFTGNEAGEYTIKAGIEINGTFTTAEMKVTVKQEDPTVVSISYTSSEITVGGIVNFAANVQNANGDTTWSCDGSDWTATGSNASFTGNAAGTYTIRARNNGAESSVTITVKDPNAASESAAE